MTLTGALSKLETNPHTGLMTATLWAGDSPGDHRNTCSMVIEIRNPLILRRDYFIGRQVTVEVTLG